MRCASSILLVAVAVWAAASATDAAVLRPPTDASSGGWWTRWPSGVVPYNVHQSLAPRAALIQDTVGRLNAAFGGEITLRLAAPGDTRYVLLMKGTGGCSSYVGRRPDLGFQPLYLGDECSAGNLMHEFLHVLGFYHEHTRPDRDAYISIDWSNVPGGETNINFVRQTDAITLGPYDFLSIMHYAAGAFALDPSRPVITRKDGCPTPSPGMGQRVDLSGYDLRAAVEYAGRNATVREPAPSPAPGPPNPRPEPVCPSAPHLETELGELHVPARADAYSTTLLVRWLLIFTGFLCGVGLALVRTVWLMRR